MAGIHDIAHEDVLTIGQAVHQAIYDLGRLAVSPRQLAVWLEQQNINVLDA